jgi:hypothetical protein
VVKVWSPHRKNPLIHISADALVDENDWQVVHGKTKCRRTLTGKGWLASFPAIPEGFRPLTVEPDADWCEECASFAHFMFRDLHGIGMGLATSQRGVAIRPIAWTSTIQYGVEEEDSLPDDQEEDLDADELDIPSSDDSAGQVRILRQTGA